MAKTSKQILGNRGEEFACEYLIKKGYEIIERNYRHKRAEIDIIAKNENVLVFIEVKTRKNNQFGNPENFVDENKERLFFQCSEEYIFKIDWKHNIRFDIIALIPKQNTFEIEHLKDVFY